MINSLISLFSSFFGIPAILSELFVLILVCCVILLACSFFFYLVRGYY